MNQTYIYLLLLISMLIAMYAQYLVSSNFKKYARVMSQKAYTGEEVARMMLNRRGINDVSVQPVAGILTDHYDPKSKTVRLSEGVYNQRSISALAVAAHEVGHAIQDNEEYSFLKFRSFFAPIVMFTNRFVYILIVMGIVFEYTGLFDLGIIFFSLTLLFQIITLPVEFDASRRALINLEEDGFINRDEVQDSKKVLASAALTYVASTLVSLIQLFRLLSMRNNNE